MKKFISFTITLLLAVGYVQPANAAQMGITVSKSTNLSAQETVTISLTNFPTKAGIYLQQCVEPITGMRAASCNRVSQLWITNEALGSFKPTESFPMTLLAKYENVDCTIQKCGITARFDRTAGADTSEDQFIPIIFNASLQSTPAATPTPLAEQKISKMITSMKNKAKVALPIQSDKGINLTYRTTTPQICSLKENVITARKAGLCKVQLFAPANESTAMLARDVNIRVR